jgi:hypothetical protein
MQYRSVPPCTDVYRRVPTCTAVYRRVPPCTDVYRRVPTCTLLEEHQTMEYSCVGYTLEYRRVLILRYTRQEHAHTAKRLY